MGRLTLGELGGGMGGMGGMDGMGRDGDLTGGIYRD